MGASSSKMEEDNALHLCSERKKYVKHALDGRCSLAASHVTYIQSLRSIGISFRKFVEPEAPIESSLCTSTSATPEALGLTEKSASHFSFYSPMTSRENAADNFSPSPSPPYSINRFQANHMTFTSSFSKKIEEKPSLPVTGIVTSSSASQNITPRSSEIHDSETSPSAAIRLSNGNSPWDYFGLLDPSENQFSFQEDRRVKEQFGISDDIRRHREEVGIPELEEEEEDNVSVSSTEEFQESEDEFDEPSTDTLVRSFNNLNRASDHVEASVSSTMCSAESTSSETELLKRMKSRSFNLSPLHDTPTAAAVPTDIDRAPVKADVSENKVPIEDFFASMKYVEELFHKASESGEEVPRMLEANKLHFRPIVPRRKGGLVASTILTACFSCGEDPSSIPREPPQTATKYLTWHRTTSSCSSSSRNPLGSASKDDAGYLNGDVPFEKFGMISGSHASTLDRLYAWERKLYDEIKASKIVRSRYDMKCKNLRGLESKGASSYQIDKTRAVVKDLHSRIRVAIHRIDHISKKIEDLRDKELQPQLEELIKGLSHMWREMSNCHKLQHDAISVTRGNGNVRISIRSHSHRHITLRLDDELGSLSSSFTKWIGAQKSYLEAINGWLLKCVKLPQKSSKRRRMQASSWRHFGPPIYVTCGEWLDKLSELPTKDVVDSVKGLAADAGHFLPSQEKAQGKKKGNTQSNGSDPKVGTPRDEALEDCTLGLDRFRSSLVGFLGQLSKFADSSKRMYEDLEIEIERAKNEYEQWNNYVKSHA